MLHLRITLFFSYFLFFPKCCSSSLKVLVNFRNAPPKQALLHQIFTLKEIITLTTFFLNTKSSSPIPSSNKTFCQHRKAVFFLLKISDSISLRSIRHVPLYIHKYGVFGLIAAEIIAGTNFFLPTSKCNRTYGEAENVERLTVCLQSSTSYNPVL